ncbi:MAG: hypothetical protein H6822_11120 [Planctomycetaceae bacterium]|nr:hypothetical protein [Planctomycetales bacterium]MCB9922725.1 hypothetical protein [Planctomycetaceae bacterium]
MGHLESVNDAFYSFSMWPSTNTSPSVVATSSCTWWDATGKFTVEAIYLGLADGTVMLKRSDGRELSVPLDKLSELDREHVA